MKDPKPSLGVRVERALHLIPEIEMLMPLRALLLSLARPPRAGTGTAPERYLTVGKRQVEPAELRAAVPLLLARISRHVAAQCDAVVEALEHERRGDLAAAAIVLLAGGRREEEVGRFAQAFAWYELTLRLVEPLRLRRPEIEALLHLARAAGELGRYEEGGRAYQRALALAEAEFQADAAVEACEGLGRLACLRGAWPGAESWYRRGLALAERWSDQVRLARIQRNLATTAMRRGDLAKAEAWLAQSRTLTESLGGIGELAATLRVEAELQIAHGRRDLARAAYRDALALAERAGDPRQHVAIQRDLGAALIEEERYLEAEDELRAGEEIAIAALMPHQLAQLYALLGRLRGYQGDEDGFVFFEKALELCQASQATPIVEGGIYYEYGVFRRRLGDKAEAAAHLEQARAVLTPLGTPPELLRVVAELANLATAPAAHRG